MSDVIWTVQVRHRTNTCEVRVQSCDTIGTLQKRIYEYTGVPPENQKLLGVSRLAQAVQRKNEGNTSVTNAGLSHGAHIMVVGATAEEVMQMQETEQQWICAHAPRTFHPSLRGARPRQTLMENKELMFLQFAVHPSTPSTSAMYEKVLRYLERLANDAAVQHVCRMHGYRVGLLTELLPHEHPHLLGLNENAGQRILLRVRTDALDGLRDYKTTRRVLVHELAHNEVCRRVRI